MLLLDRQTHTQKHRTFSGKLGTVQEPKMFGVYWKYLVYTKIFISMLLLLESSREIKDTLKCVTTSILLLTYVFRYTSLNKL